MKTIWLAEGGSKHLVLRLFFFHLMEAEAEAVEGRPVRRERRVLLSSSQDVKYLTICSDSTFMRVMAVTSLKILCSLIS